MECTKQIIDKYYTDNTPKLQTVASNILTNVSRSDLADTLVTESYLYLIEKEEKLRGKITKALKNNKEESVIESIAVQFMHKQIVWNGTKFKRNFVDEDYSNCEYNDELDVDAYELDDEEVMEREFEHMSKIAHIEAKYQALDVPNRILYDLAIRGEYNTSGKLAKYLNLNRTTSYYLIKNLKEHLRDGYTN